MVPWADGKIAQQEVLFGIRQAMWCLVRMLGLLSKGCLARWFDIWQDCLVGCFIKVV